MRDRSDLPDDRVAELLEHLLELPPERRAARLRELRAEPDADPAVLDTVERLLNEDPDAADAPLRLFDSERHALQAVLTAAAGDDSAAPAHPALVGQRVGGYRVLELINAGGMGDVYRAEQDDPRRVVALKFLKHALTSGAERLRFRQEAGALARLSHPGIAQIFAADTDKLESGPRLPFFAMEYVPDALPITEYAEKHKLSIRARVALFAEVCDAVQHAHTKGLIHRDLKPSNMLVTTLDGRPAPKLIDFGIARSTDPDAPQHTRTGMFMGSTDYMSFEQFENPHDADARSDVYSLGAVLYELLTGRRARSLEGKPPSEVINSHTRLKPDSPSVIRRELRGDVETIVLKSLRTAPGERYQSAADLARDLRHYLNHELIDAVSPTLLTRAIRWVAARPARATMWAGVFAVGLLIGGGALYGAYLSGVPDRIVVDPERTRARVLDRNNTTLKEFGMKEPREPSFRVSIADLVNLPKGGRIAILGVPGADGALPTLRVFNPDRYLFQAQRSFSQPLWESRFEPTDFPDRASSGEERIDPDSMYLHDARVVNFFGPPDGAGNEIIAFFVAWKRTHTTIRIYDFAGNVLYQVWVDGLVDPDCWDWLPVSRLLVLGITSGQLTCSELAGTYTPGSLHPCAILALRPHRITPTEPRNQYVGLYAKEPPDRAAPLRPEWVRFVTTSDGQIAPWCSIPEARAEPTPSRPEAIFFTVALEDPRSVYKSTRLYWRLAPDGTVLSEPTPYPNAAQYASMAKDVPEIPASPRDWALSPLDYPRHLSPQSQPSAP